MNENLLSFYSFFYRKGQCFLLNSRKQIIQSTFLPVLDYDTIIYMNAVPISLKPVGSYLTLCPPWSILHSSLHSLSESSWPLLVFYRLEHCILFIYQALTQKLPHCLTSLLTYESMRYHTHSQGWLTLQIPYVSTDLGKNCFKFLHTSLMEQS